MAGVGRMAIDNVLRQVGKQFGRDAMERLINGEAIESVLTRDQMRELARKTGKLALEELMRVGKEEFKKKH